ncbi:hypothetical protein [uncultured Nocardioides sp.]|uniref:hypothetical protein n=1 Tax=uncultured Nocardioides sp. TaxID=198441 RepID=UPI0026110A1D|nr:hypothetical protein [uncultured Nocardioides sp.]
MSRRTALAVPLLATLVAGCSSDGGSGDVDRADMRDDVRASVQETVAQLGEADLRPLRASGRYTTCEESGYEYRGGALLSTTGDLAAAIEDAERVLAGAGWEVDDSERGRTPFVNLSRGPLEASVKESQVEPGAIELGIDHDCVDGERDDTPSFDPEEIDVGA